MTLSTQEATAALGDLEAIRLRSSTLWGYQKQAPFLFLWAALYVIGYGISYAAPSSAGPAWIAIGTGGGVASWVIGMRMRPGAQATGHVLKFWLIALTIALFIIGTFIVLPATDQRQVGAFIPLVVALIYALYGTLLSPRLGVVGLALGALTIAGYQLIPGANFLLWMAAVGGGALALGGVWLRRA